MIAGIVRGFWIKIEMAPLRLFFGGLGEDDLMEKPEIKYLVKLSLKSRDEGEFHKIVKQTRPNPRNLFSVSPFSRNEMPS